MKSSSHASNESSSSSSSSVDDMSPVFALHRVMSGGQPDAGVSLNDETVEVRKTRQVQQKHDGSRREGTPQTISFLYASRTQAVV
jgi:hypothetical protein